MPFLDTHKLGYIMFISAFTHCFWASYLVSLMAKKIPHCSFSILYISSNNSFDRYLHCFQFLVLLKIATVNITVHIFYGHAFSFLLYMYKFWVMCCQSGYTQHQYLRVLRLINTGYSSYFLFPWQSLMKVLLEDRGGSSCQARKRQQGLTLGRGGNGEPIPRIQGLDANLHINHVLWHFELSFQPLVLTHLSLWGWG